MTEDIIVFNNFLKRFGLYREYYRELRLARPDLFRTNGGGVEFPDHFSSKDYVILFFNWEGSRRGPHFWSLVHYAWREYRSKNL